MNRILLLLVFLPFAAFAQNVSQKLQTAFQQFEKDEQLSAAISSLYVIDAKTGKVVFEKNAHVGLAPASTQKIITSVTAFELLGKDFRYETSLFASLPLTNGELFFNVSGDPTLGSTRYANTKPELLFKNLLLAVQKSGIGNLKKPIAFNYDFYPYQTIPDGWIWEDIGNYYGAGASILNWRENQYEIMLNSAANEGEVIVISPGTKFINELVPGPKGSGDQAFCYIPLHENAGFLNGSIPVNEKAFSISAADHNPATTMLREFDTFLSKNSISTNGIFNFTNELLKPKSEFETIGGISKLYTHYSPSLDSIVYWFNKKSINLYGEALVKTFGHIKKEHGSTDSGVAVIKTFWKTKGISEHELNIFDGSGLSPLNRVTTHAQVEILKYAKTKSWFQHFYNSLPQYNDMIMKSGTINNTKGFCGYHTAKNGKEYIFSFLVNNYNGKSATLVQKMYRVLNELK
jgi:D-alanyl-D-alanine carboxypeptidase/D-alanyl-D-alanine-endopeptidase (penicillin-binding protein 4)